MRRISYWYISGFIIVALLTTGCDVLSAEFTPFSSPSPSPSPTPPPVSGILIPPGGIPTYHPEGVRALTQEEQAKITEAALNTPAALEQLKKESQYTTSIGWVAIAWKDETHTDFSEMRSYPYDIVEKGVEKGGIDISAPGSTIKVFTTAPPESAIFYPDVVIHFGLDWVVSVAIDLETFQTVHQSGYPNLSSPNRFPNLQSKGS